jgi:hypothetical protein
LVQTDRRLQGWRQQRDGRFPTSPDLSLALPIAEERQAFLDLSFSSHALDLDGDRRADYVLFAGDRDASEVRTQVLVYLQGKGQGEAAKTAEDPLFGPRGLPQQLLILRGLAGAPELIDVDGDQKPDLVVGAVRPDLIDAIRSASSARLDAELHVYKNLGGRFSPNPDLTYRTSLAADGLEALGRSLLVRFCGDVTGDGLSELVMRDQADRLRMFLVRRSGQQLQLVDKPLWELRVDGEADVKLLLVGGRPELVVVEKEQVVHVRWP